MLSYAKSFAAYSQNTSETYLLELALRLSTACLCIGREINGDFFQQRNEPTTSVMQERRRTSRFYLLQNNKVDDANRRTVAPFRLSNYTWPATAPRRITVFAYGLGQHAPRPVDILEMLSPRRSLTGGLPFSPLAGAVFSSNWRLFRKVYDSHEELTGDRWWRSGVRSPKLFQPA